MIQSKKILQREDGERKSNFLKRENKDLKTEGRKGRERSTLFSFLFFFFTFSFSFLFLFSFFPHGETRDFPSPCFHKIGDSHLHFFSSSKTSCRLTTPMAGRASHNNSHDLEPMTDDDNQQWKVKKKKAWKIGEVSNQQFSEILGRKIGTNPSLKCIEN